MGSHRDGTAAAPVAVQAGAWFMAWVFSGCMDRTLETKLSAFFAAAEWDWEAFRALAASSRDSTTQAIASLPEGILRQWYNLGATGLFVANVCGTGDPPRELVDGVLGGYRRFLIEAGVDIEERDKILHTLTQLTVNRAAHISTEDPRAKFLGRLLELLEDAATRATKAPPHRQSVKTGVISAG